MTKGERMSDTVTSTYRLWVNAERTLLARVWASGMAEVATRETPEHTWGPPIFLSEEDE